MSQGPNPERPSLGDELVRVGYRSASLMNRLVRLAAAFDLSGEWALEGATTAAHWIASALDIEVSTAREWVRVGHALEDLPVISEALSDQRISYTKARSLVRFATPTNEIELCDLAQKVRAGDLPRALAAWSARNDEPEEIDARQQRDRSLTWRTEADGMIVGSFRLPPLAGAAVVAVIEANVHRSTTDGGNDASKDASATRKAVRSTIRQQRADALVSSLTSGGSTVSTEVILHVRGDGCTMNDGTPVVDTVVERIASESFIRAMIHNAESRPINVSERHRHPTRRQRLVVEERDGACVDCGATVFLHCDHDPDFATSGRTVVDELKLRCGGCHRRRHREEEERRRADGRASGGHGRDADTPMPEQDPVEDDELDDPEHPE